MRKAKVYINGLFCGVLTEDYEGYHFSYTPEYLALEGASQSSRLKENLDNLLTIKAFYFLFHFSGEPYSLIFW